MTIKYQSRVYTDQNQLRVKICATAPRDQVQRNGFRLDDDGRVWAKVKSDDGPLKGSVSDHMSGFRFDENGTLLIATQGTVGYRHNGFAFRKDGAVFVTNGKAASKWHGLGHDAKGYLCVEGLAAAWDLTSSLTGLEGTDLSFTRDSTATYYGPDGLITTAVSDGVRFDYNPATLEKRGLLIEEVRTNLCLQSADFNTSWVTLGSPTINSGALSYGIVSLDLIGDDDAAVPEGYQQVISFTGDGSKAISLFWSPGTSPAGVIILNDSTAVAERLRIDLNSDGSVTATTGTVNNVELQNGVYRAEMVATGVVAANNNQLNIYAADTADTGDIYYGGVQAEDALYPSSYIPTTTVAVTRSADICRDTSISWFNATEGTFVCEFEMISLTADINRFVYDVSNNSSTDRIDHYIQTNGNYAYQGVDGGSGEWNFTNGSVKVAPPAGSRSASAYKLNDIALSVEGNAPNTVTGTIGTVSEMNVGTAFNESSPLNGWIRSISYYNKRLTNGEVKGMS